MSVMWSIYWLSFLIVVIAGLALAYKLTIKDAVVGFFVLTTAAIIPVLNTVVAGIFLGFCINHIMEDDDPTRWYNKPLFPKKDPNK